MLKYCKNFRSKVLFEILISIQSQNNYIVSIITYILKMFYKYTGFFFALEIWHC